MFELCAVITLSKGSAGKMSFLVCQVKCISEFLFNLLNQFKFIIKLTGDTKLTMVQLVNV